MIIEKVYTMSVEDLIEAHGSDYLEETIVLDALIDIYISNPNEHLDYWEYKAISFNKLNQTLDLKLTIYLYNSEEE